MRRGSASPRITVEEGLKLVEELLRGDARKRLLAELVAGADTTGSLDRLRKAMRSHTLSRELRRVVDALDSRTRREGFHVLEGWDFASHRFAKDIAPVLLVDYCERMGIAPQRLRDAMAVLLDQYLLAILSLLAMRAWDSGDANENLDRVTGALDILQGPNGAGHRFVGDAGTLLMLAVSYFHPEEQGYDLLVDRVASLDRAHRIAVAVPCAAMMGFHLRWGLRFMYRRDVGRMRADNVADYPLLLFALVTLAEEYATPHGGREHAVVEGLLNGLSADPWAFVDTGPAAVATRAAWHATVHHVLQESGASLLDDFAALQPSTRAYSPLSFTCNFPTNASVAMAAIAVQGETHAPIDALFTRGTEPAPLRLAERLMEFATSDSSRLGAGGVPLIAYDPYEGAGAFNTTIRTLRDAVSRGSSRS